MSKEEKSKKKGKNKKLGYKEELEFLQIELLKMQYHIKKTGEKILIIFEGRDAAGKGGTIKRIREHLNPRGCTVVALPKPSDVEVTQWYFQRYTTHLPSAGEIVIFDRSWYNRAMVEPVMGFCTPSQTKQFLEEVPFFESLIQRADIKIYKIFLDINKKTQEKRFEERRKNPLKSYKLSPVDKDAQKKWNEYSVAIYNMFIKTDSIPWTIIDSNDKKSARLNAIKTILNGIEYEEKCSPERLKVDEDLVQTVRQKGEKMAEIVAKIPDIETLKEDYDIE